jgi:seryl-tRNA synthetase
MNKTGSISWKTPLGYYEKAIEELRRTQEALQAEIENIRELKSDYANLKGELKATKQELEATQTELKVIKLELEATKADFKNTKQFTEDLLVKTQDKANSAISEVTNVKAGIENGSIVAQKALMLRGKDEENWIRFRQLDSVNHHCLQVWQTDDTWHDDIRVKAASLLQARDDQHWMRFKYVRDGKYDTYHIWQRGGIWHHTVRVGVAKKTM